jgi:hypothetical protein
VKLRFTPKSWRLLVIGKRILENRFGLRILMATVLVATPAGAAHADAATVDCPAQLKSNLAQCTAAYGGGGMVNDGYYATCVTAAEVINASCVQAQSVVPTKGR